MGKYFNNIKNYILGYWETLGDDVTVTKFDPEDSNKLVTGSSDGQVSIINMDSIKTRLKSLKFYFVS